MLLKFRTFETVKFSKSVEKPRVVLEQVGELNVSNVHVFHEVEHEVRACKRVVLVATHD